MLMTARRPERRVEESAAWQSDCQMVGMRRVVMMVCWRGLLWWEDDGLVRCVMVGSDAQWSSEHFQWWAELLDGRPV